jgi:hypothetical protein
MLLLYPGLLADLTGYSSGQTFLRAVNERTVYFPVSLAHGPRCHGSANSGVMILDSPTDLKGYEFSPFRGLG